MNRFFRCFLSVMPLVVLAGCSSQASRTAPTMTPDQARARIVQLLPTKTADRQGWAVDIYAAFAAQGLSTSDDNLCSVLAVTEQESTFQADPPVPGLATIARAEINQIGRAHV